MWDLKYDTNKLTYKAETDSQTQKKTYGYQRGRRKGQVRRRTHTHTLPYLNNIYINKQYIQTYKQGPSAKHRERYSIIDNKGKVSYKINES